LKQSNWVYWRTRTTCTACQSRLRWFALLLAVLFLYGLSSYASAEVSALRLAKMAVETSRATYLVPNQTLPFKWDADFPGENGRATYQLTLPARNLYATAGSQELFAIYIPRLGSQVQVWVNGQLVARQGLLDEAIVDASQTPFFASIPASLLHDSEPNFLMIQSTVQALRWGGISEVYFGLERKLSSTHGLARLWQQTSYVVILIAMVLMGLISFFIWLHQRADKSAKLYLYFVYSALAGSMAALDHLLMSQLMPWPVQGVAAAVALAWHVIFMSRFALEVVGRQEDWVSLTMLATAVAIGIAYLLAEPFYATITYGLLCLPLVAVLICTAKAADSEQSGQARSLFFVCLIVAAAALRDFFIVQWPVSGMSHFVLLPQALFLFVLVMGWILVKRYTEQHRLYHDLNIHLESRVAQREQELAQSFEQQQQQGQERAKLLERQRIMQDIHDGVGGQLVSLVNMAKREHQSGNAVDTKQLQVHAQLALDELRIAVDAMQPVDGDLATVLATLRYRLEPRLIAAGVRLNWAVQELPLMVDLTPQKVLQIQKILLEALTNVMLHAKAKTVTISAQPTESRIVPSFVEISLIDDGVGFDLQHSRATGHGLANMRFRADAIGAQLTLARGLPEGMVVKLKIPT
jgi:signal transduction histidine kinase